MEYLRAFLRDRSDFSFAFLDSRRLTRRTAERVILRRRVAIYVMGWYIYYVYLIIYLPIYNLRLFEMGAGQSSSSGASSSSRHRSRSRSRSRGRRHHHHGNRGHWSASSPKSVGDRSAVLKKCGRRCFLGPGKSFPVCARLGSTSGAGTCKIDRHGVQAAYSRAREWAAITARKKRTSANAREHRKYTAIARRAKSLLSRIKK